jgi:hypothetical protein
MTIFSKSSESVFPENYVTQEGEGEREVAGDYSRVRNEQMARGPDGAGFSSKHIFTPMVQKLFLFLWGPGGPDRTGTGVFWIPQKTHCGPVSFVGPNQKPIAVRSHLWDPPPPGPGDRDRG